MRKEIVLDVETKKLFSEVEKNDPKQLEVSFIGIYQSETGIYRGFFENELDQLWPILEASDLIIGFNIIKFDYPVMSAYYPGDFSKFQTLDLLETVREALGFRIGLDNLSRATLGLQKTADGLQAIEFYRNGELQKLAEYCLNDVKMTKELYDYAVSHKSMKYYDLNQIREFPVTISLPETPNSDIQMSLGM